MWPVVILVQPPGLDFRTRIFDGQELIHVQAFIPPPAVKRFYVPVIHRLSRAREVLLNQWTLATKLIDHREHAKWPAVEQRIMHDIHAPALAMHSRLGYGTRCRHICLRRRIRILSCIPSSRYRRRTSFLFTCQPSRRSITGMRLKPKPGRTSAISRIRRRKAVGSFAWLLRLYAERENCARWKAFRALTW